MKILSGGETEGLLENVIHSETQTGAKGFDLTVDKIYEAENRGKLDFGGSEMEKCKIREIKPEKKKDGDKYGWWILDPGTYLMEYNEQLKRAHKALLQPHTRLTRNSASHPTKLVRELGLVPLYIEGEGLEIKENARVSRILMLK